MRYYDSLGAAGYPISGGDTYEQSFQSHLDRGSNGGVDYAVGVGRIIYAPTKGRVLNRSTTGGGNTARFYHIDDSGAETGWYDEFLHLSSFGPDGAIFQPGDDIGARSGNSGTQTTGPHVHWHLCNPQGQRQRQWLLFQETTKRGKDMIYVRNMQKGTNYGYVYLVGADYIHAVATTEVSGLNAIYGMPVDFGDYNDLVRTIGAYNVPPDIVFGLQLGKTWSRVAALEAANPAAIAKAVNDDVSKRMAQ